jgi:hypothetical protein
MNIFAVDKDPLIAAQSLCDKHVVKMIVETAQLLSTAHRVLDGTMEIRTSSKGRKQKYYKHSNPILEENLYKATHVNHPSAIWARQSNNNYNWLYCHFIGLCDEYRHRYGKTHLSEQKLGGLLSTPPRNIEISHFSYPTPAMPDEFKSSNIIESYRLYYLSKYETIDMRWTNRELPRWFA